MESNKIIVAGKGPNDQPSCEKSVRAVRPVVADGWETVSELASDPHYLGATVGLLAVLHTWGQTLCHHPQVHGVVTGGGRACDMNGRAAAPARWRACRPEFFLPVRLLSRLFRGKFLAALPGARPPRRLGPAGR